MNQCERLTRKHRMIEGYGAVFCLVLAVAVLFPASIPANTPQAQLHIGRLWTNPEYDGAEGWSESCWQYPGGIAKPSFWGTSNDIKRGWVGQGKKFGTYLWSTNWIDPRGTTWQHAMSYCFRSMNYDYPNQYVTAQESDRGNMNYVYPVGCQEVLRWERPAVMLEIYTPSGTDSVISIEFYPGEEDLESVVYMFPDNAGVFARPAPLVDPNLVTEEVIHNTWRYIMGVELNRDQYAYPFGSVHQDYILNDIVLTNNGISGNHPDGAVETNPVIADNNMENMIWAQAFDYRNQSTDGINADGDAAIVYPFGSDDHPAVLCWDTDDPNTTGPDWGDPSKSPGYNRPTLVGNCYCLLGCLFASTDPGTDPGAGSSVDDPSQPNFIIATLERGVDLKGDSGYPTSDPAIGPAEARSRVIGGLWQLNELGTGDTFQNDLRYADVVANNGGPTVILGYGRKNGDISVQNFASHGWDLEQNEHVRIVQLWAGGGIDRDEASRICSYYRSQEASGAAESDWMTAEDIALIQSGQDTAMKASALAYWNFNGQFPANIPPVMLEEWNIADYPMMKPACHPAFDVPEAPRPPDFIATRMVRDKGIEIRWGTVAEDAPDHDTGVSDFLGYRIYRQMMSNNGEWELIADFNGSYPPVADADEDYPAGRFYWDWQVTPGTEYHYCVVAYDDGTQNWARPGVSLESTRWWTWTGYTRQGVCASNNLPWRDPNPGTGPLPRIEISGAIPTTTWTKTRSPYHVTGQCTVKTANTLTIEAGVDVFFDADCQFVVEGALHAHGTGTDSVRFLKGTASEWGGLRLTTEDSCSFAYTRLSDGNSDGISWYGSGGGIYCSNSRLSMSHCVISNNRAASSGGGMCLFSARAVLDNCVISQNVSSDEGGGIGNTSSRLLATHCTISGNTASNAGGGLHNRDGIITLADCIMWGDSLQEISSQSGTVTVTSSCIEGGYTGDGNISDDPLFVDAAHGDYHLQIESPCIRTASDRGDMGAVPFTKVHFGNLILPSTSGYTGNVVITRIKGTIYTPKRSASLVFTVDSSFIDSVTLVNSAFDGLADAISSCNVKGDTVLIGLAASEALTMTDETVVNLRFHISSSAPADTIALTWIAEKTAVDDDVTPDLTDGELEILIGYGDASRDGQVTSYDAQMVLEQFVQIRSDVDLLFGDVSGNGTITAYDAALILYRVVNPEYLFPVQDGEPPARAAHTTIRTLRIAQNGGGWVVSVNDADGIRSGGLTLNMPGDYGVRVTGGAMSFGNRNGDEVRIGFVSDGSGDQVLLRIEPVGTAVEDLALPGIIEAELNEGAIPLEPLVPLNLELSQNAPNPFNPVTTIRFSLPEASVTNLVVYDVLGRQVRTLVSGQVDAGIYSLVWDGCDAVGRPVASGVHVYRLTTANGTLVRRMTMIR